MKSAFFVLLISAILLNVANTGNLQGSKFPPFDSHQGEICCEFFDSRGYLHWEWIKYDDCMNRGGLQGFASTETSCKDLFSPGLDD
mmetsp:Transcript_22163/g.23115  ORF Transcript_22163/g.23115 Transcript_22163/m.23115 type:complete len:86 (-) Transcript_22163:106-363(-)